MRLNQIMKRPVKTVGRNTTLEEAVQLMRVHELRHLVVVEGRRVVGTISEREFGGPRGTLISRLGLVHDWMVEHVITATPRTTTREAANLMRGHRIGCLPVIDEGKLVGIVTDTDLLELLGTGAEAPSPRKKRATLKARKPILRQTLPRGGTRGSQRSGGQTN